jgi:hypothetical protein
MTWLSRRPFRWHDLQLFGQGTTSYQKRYQVSCQSRHSRVPLAAHTRATRGTHACHLRYESDNKRPHTPKSQDYVPANKCVARPV